MQLSELLETMRKHFESLLADKAYELYPEGHSYHEACRYALAGQGKRIRPLLVYLSHQAAGGRWQDADLAALAIEMVHTYSLVHDDLPCMDDDDWRRGRATTHKVYDEATALLVGDSLLTDALGLLAQIKPEAKAAKLTLELAQAAGGRGMILGQALDIYWTNRAGYQQSDLDRIHQLKTGKLIAASCVMGAALACNQSEKIQCLREFGALLGLAFQITDDLLDDKPGTGKSAGKDRIQNKLTYLQIMSADEAEARAQALTDDAFARLQGFGEEADPLRELARLLLSRQN